jgi:hypothetical protein
MKQSVRPWVAFATYLLLVVAISGRGALAQASDSATIEELKQIIFEQQRQLQEQSKTLDAQAKLLDELVQRVESIQRSAEEAQETAASAEAKAEAAQATTGGAAGPTVASGQERVKLAISGQINRAINVVDDGDKTKVYFVDNDVSNSRIRFVGTGEVTDDLTFGTQIELGISPNNSSKVSQDNEDDGDTFDERKVEIFADSQRYGRVTLGKGSMASDGSAEADLSGLDVIMYSGVADIAGGIKFHEEESEDLTDVTVGDVFLNFDGLGRKDRILYESPRFRGYSLASSFASDQRYDLALNWAGRGHGIKAAAAAAISELNKDDVDYRLDGSFSVLHEATGLNLTASAGVDETDGADDPSNLYLKGGWLGEIFEIGNTGFGADFTRSDNLPDEGDYGYSVGLSAVQSLADYGTDFYAQLRWYQLDRDNQPDVDDVVVGTVGTRVKF